MSKIPFIITIDTEADNEWTRDHDSAFQTNNTRFLPRFQTLCETYDFKPVYLTDFTMASDPDFVTLSKGWLENGTCEIGMHLHSWTTPPFDEVKEGKAYLIEFSEEIMEKKINSITAVLESAYGKKIRSHRAGRWAMDERYLALLKKYGYDIDCSVTPGIKVKPSLSGAPALCLGYEGFPFEPYQLSLENMAVEGHSGIWEVPMTLERKSNLTRSVARLMPERVKRKLLRQKWFRPDGGNLKSMIKLARFIERRKGPCLEFMLHSSEFMPGGSPNFPDDESIDVLYGQLRDLFDYLAPRFRGMTLSEYIDERNGI